VTLEVLDAKGKLVRRYSAADQPDVTEADLKKLSIPRLWVREPRTLPGQAGLHRWLWDLHHTPPESLRHEYPIAAVPHDTPRVPEGPRVLPGSYTVKLTAGGQSLTAQLTVKMDPRVKTTPAGLQQQFEAETELASMMTRSTEAIWQARSIDEQIEKLAHGASGSLADQLAAIDKRIKAELAAPPGATQPTLALLNRQTSALYGDVDSADVAPNAAQAIAIAKIKGDFPVVMTRWSGLTGTDIPALNRQLRGAQLQEITLDVKKAHEDDADDSDLE